MLWVIQDGYLGENGEDPNQLDPDQMSPLEWAHEKTEFHVFKALVENQADMNFKC